MFEQDKARFKEMFSVLAEVYGREPLSNQVLQFNFAALGRFTIEQVEFGIQMHSADTKEGQFFPKVANIVKHIEGEELTCSEVLAMANLATTPLGVFCQAHIGHWTLTHAKESLQQRMAYECMELIPDWKTIGITGDYSDNQLRMLMNNDVSPLQPFCRGMQPPLYQEKLKARSGAMRADAEASKKIEAPEKMPMSDEEVAAAKEAALKSMAELVGMFGAKDDSDEKGK